MAIHSNVIIDLDERAAKQTADLMVRQMKEAGTQAGNALSQGMSQGMTARSEIDRAVSQYASTVNTAMAAHGRKAAEGYGAAFSSQLTRSLPGVSGFASAMAGYEGAAAKSGALAGRALGMAFTTAAGGLMGAAAYTLFKGFERYEAIDTAKNRLDNLNRTLAATGKETVNVGAVMETVNQVVLDTPFKLDQAFSVATRALASNTGDLKRFMTDVSDAAGFAQAPIEDIGNAFLKIANQGKVSMEELQNELRNIPIQPWLAETMHVSGAQLTKMIHDNKVGLNDLLRAVEANAAGFAKASGNTIRGQIEIMQATVARTGANFIGAIFGKPAEQGNELLTALKAVNDRLREVDAWVKAHQQEIHAFFQKAAEIARDVAKAAGEIGGLLKDHPGLVYAAVTAWGAFKALNIAGSVAEAVTQLKLLQTTMAATSSAAPAAAAGITAAFSTVAAGIAIAAGELVYMYNSIKNAPVVPPTGAAPPPGATQQQRDIFAQGGTGGLYDIPRSQGGFGPEPGDPDYRAPGSTPGGLPKMPPWTAPNGQTYTWDWGKGGWVDASGNHPTDSGAAPHGGAIQPPSGAAGGDGKPHLPKAPVVPYDTALPPGFENLPMSSGLYSAESSFLDNRHKLAEKQARLAQLEKDGAATEQDVLDARNDVVTAGRDLQQSEMRLYEERASIFGKHNKQIKSWLSELGEIGASLDQDFGISKGLAGIAENITKFIANLAAAPLLGQLGASQIAAGYKPGEAGQGLMGALAAGGAFGSQYQIPGSIASGLAKAGGLPGMGGLNWDALAAKESGGNWGANTGNGYFGGLQFDQSTWNAYKPPGAPDNPALATREQQIQAGMAGIQARGGPQSLWPQNWQQLGGGGPLGLTGGGVAGMFGGAGYGGGAGAAAAGMSARDFAHNVMMPFWQARGLTVGDHAADQYGEHQNGALDIMVPDLPTGQQVLQQVLSDPNVYGAIFNRNSYGYGHGNVPQPYGGDNPHTDHVHAWYKPGNAGNIPVPGMGVPGLGGFGVQAAGFGQGGGLGAGTGGGGGASDVHGWGGTPGPGLPGLPQTSNPTRIGGVAPPQGSGSGGAGLGGLAMAGLQAGIGAAGMAGAPFGGQAGAAVAQAMMELANRGIKFASQAAGIGVQGLMETFLPAGSELANNNWVTKIAGGLAGAAPMLPNIAGKGDEGSQQLTPDQVVGQGQGMGLPGADQAKNVDNSKNVTNQITINGANINNEQSMANTVAMQQQAMYA